MSELSAKLNLIWYGEFEVHQNNPCTSVNLEDHQATIKRVYRVEGNTWPTYRSGATGNTFTTLECGYAYIVELTDANQSVNIPHANLSPGDSTAPRGLLVAEVTLATPSPSPSPSSAKAGGINNCIKAGGKTGTCDVCTQGITTVICGEASGSDSPTSNTNITGVGAYGFINRAGRVYNPSTEPTTNHVRAGYFLQSGVKANDNSSVLFYVKGGFEAI